MGPLGNDPLGHVDQAAASMLEALFTQSPIGLHLVDPDLRVVRVNTATPWMRDVSLDDIRGQRARDVYRLVDADAEALLRDVLDTGTPVLRRIVRALVDEAPVERTFEVNALRLQGLGGKVLGVGVIAVDVTERERAHARTRMLDRVREGVGRTLDPVVIGEELAAILVPDFADLVTVEVEDAVIRGDDPPLARAPIGTLLMRTAFRSAIDEAAQQIHAVGDVRRLADPTPFTQALADLSPRMVRFGPDTPWLAADPALARAVDAARGHSLLVVPLALRDAALGLVSLYRADRSPVFDEEDRALAMEVGTHTALCLDNARRYTREHTIAATVQRQLLPRRPEAQAWLETAYLSLTGADPGAWYDTTALSSARTAIVVGKVSGRGLEAAATMGQLRTAIRSLSAFDLTPDELLARLHDTATRLAAERARLPLGDPLRQEELTADCVYAVHDPLTGSCVAAAAGHLAPLVVRPEGTVSVLGTPAGPRLGSAEGAPFAAVDADVPAGSVLVFTSDPLLTAYLAERPGPLASVSRYGDRPLQDLCDALVYALPAGMGVRDAAVIVARTRAFPPDQCAVWPLDPDPTAVSAVRRRTRAQLTAWGVEEETAYNTQLIASELVTNALRYGRPPIELRLIRGRTLTCEVRDADTAAPHLRHAGTVDEGGRGLFIVAQLAQAWGTRPAVRGKTIWAEQTL
ncbi:SpoIIE family protein phosphatase [Streptomyces sp. NPDC046859]|uniref:SpoIIE family protein phosphatase n=1 Tax=Streptomyces sp. NPDC046859 TaxID=3155734 RepID=UPI0033C3FE5B